MKNILTITIFGLLLMACNSNNSYNEKNAKIQELEYTLAQLSSTKEKENIQLIEERINYGGIYSYGTYPGTGQTGIIYVYPNSDSTLLFYLDLSRGAPSYNSGSLVGQMNIYSPGEANYTMSPKEYDLNCSLNFQFKNDTLYIRTNDNADDCGYGYGVYSEGNFILIDSITPEFYIDGVSEKTYFDKEKQLQQRIEKVTFDSLLISTQEKRYVKVIVDRLSFKNENDCDYCESADISYSIYDENNTVIYQKNYPVTFDSWSNITPSSVYLEGIGDVLVINKIDNPSCSNCNGDVNLFGFSESGSLSPLTKAISINGSFSEDTYMKTKLIYALQKGLIEEDNSEQQCNDCVYFIETTNHSGWCGFEILEYHPFFGNGVTDGHQESTPLKLDKTPVNAGKSNLITLNKFSDYLTNTDVKLYSKPDTESTSKVITLEIGTVIKFYYIIKAKNKRFIYLTIDGVNGYINDFNELDKMGFPACD